MMKNEKLNPEESVKSASSIQAMALFFVTLFGCAWCLKDMARETPSFLVARWIGVLPSFLCMGALGAIAAIWFLRGHRETSSTRVIGVIISALTLSIFLGTVQGAPEASLWGGKAGRNMGRLLLQFPSVIATGLAGLGLVMGFLLSFRLWTQDDPQAASRGIATKGLLLDTLEAPPYTDIRSSVPLARTAATLDADVTAAEVDEGTLTETIETPVVTDEMEFAEDGQVADISDDETGYLFEQEALQAHEVTAATEVEETASRTITIDGDTVPEVIAFRSDDCRELIAENAA